MAPGSMRVITNDAIGDGAWKPVSKVDLWIAMMLHVEAAEFAAENMELEFSQPRSDDSSMKGLKLALSGGIRQGKVEQIGGNKAGWEPVVGVRRT